MPTLAPRGLSCLTCRQRRKKCDRVRPVCERCTKGKFECLGYDNEEHRAGSAIREAEDLPQPSGRAESKQIPNLGRIRPIRPKPNRPATVPVGIVASGSSVNAPEPEISSGGLSTSPLNPVGSHEVLSHSILPMGLVGREAPSHQTLAMPHSDERSASRSPAERYDKAWPQDQSGSITRLRHMAPIAHASQRRILPAEVLAAVQEMDIALGLLQRSIPRSVNANAQMRESHLSFSLKEYELARGSHYFKRPPEAVVDQMVWLVTRSQTILRFMYLGTRIFRALIDKTQNTTMQACIRWADRVDYEFTQNPPSNPPADMMEDILCGLLELVFLKFVVISTVGGYLLLQRSLPIFLQMVATEPEIWSEQRGILRISLPRALEVPRYQIRRFAFYDTMCSLVLGVAPLGEYDSSDFPVVPDKPRLFEWYHGVPAELLISLAQVHTWRASNPGLPNEGDWPVLELRTMVWKPDMEQLVDDDSVRTVERVAVQESWRHATLIYIYMGMCRVNSHDPRVQLSVRQIIQLMGLAAETLANVHFSIPCLVAGIAACSERQRAFVRDKIESFRGTRTWIVRGVEFCAVLDHLWHGVASGGSAVTWDDYVNSRCIMLPIQ